MPRRFFRQFTVKRQDLETRWYLRPFRVALADPKIASIQRRSVVAAVGIGVFCAWIPLPVQFIVASLLAIAVRANVAVAAVATLVTNPVTMAPMFYLAFQVGLALLSQPTTPFVFDLSWHWLTHEFPLLWKPLLTGCLTLASASSLLAMLALDLTWRFSVAAAVRARRLKRRRRFSLSHAVSKAERSSRS
ncbi:MAG: DUF2062 domain-containing protein [Pseudomonadota bacterium]